MVQFSGHTPVTAWLGGTWLAHCIPLLAGQAVYSFLGVFWTQNDDNAVCPLPLLISSWVPTATPTRLPSTAPKLAFPKVSSAACLPPEERTPSRWMNPDAAHHAQGARPQKHLTCSVGPQDSGCPVSVSYQPSSGYCLCSGSEPADARFLSLLYLSISPSLCNCLSNTNNLI